jgi:hypothetical protein
MPTECELKAWHKYKDYTHKNNEIISHKHGPGERLLTELQPSFLCKVSDTASYFRSLPSTEGATPCLGDKKESVQKRGVVPWPQQSEISFW